MKLMFGRAQLWLSVCAVLFLASCGGGSAPVDTDSGDTPKINVNGLAHGDSVRDLVDISASASDSGTVASLTLYINNQAVERSSGGNLEYDWNTLPLSDGWVPVALMAKDEAGHRGYAAMAIWVGNGESVPDSPPPAVEPPVIIEDPNPPQPEPDPVVKPTPKPEPKPDPEPKPVPPVLNPGASPLSGSGTASDPFKISLNDKRGPGIPVVLLLGLDIGAEIYGIWHTDIICSDDVGVQELKVYAGQELLADSDNGTASLNINTLDYPEGLLDFTLLLYDGYAHYSCDVMVFVANTKDHSLPKLRINGFDDIVGTKELMAFGQYEIRAEAEDPQGIKSLTIRVWGDRKLETSGDGKVTLHYTFDTWDYSDPYNAVEPGYQQLGHRFDGEKYVSVLVTAIDNEGNAKESTLSFKIANRIICTNHARSQFDGQTLSGARVWLEVHPPGEGNENYLETVESTVDDSFPWWNLSFPEGIPVGDWILHCEYQGEEANCLVHVDPYVGLYRYSKDEPALILPLPLAPEA